MQLEYFWIGSFINIENQEFNLGGKFLYSSIRISENEYQVSRLENSHFVNNFFKVKGHGFSNITAIVGENGSGKSNTLDFIRGIINNRFIGNNWGRRSVLIDFVAIFTDQKGDIFVMSNLDGITFSFNFKYSSLSQSSVDFFTIYYSPAYDFKSFTVEDIDVSSSFLLKEDHEVQEFANNNISQADNHKYANSSRQIEFINSLNLHNDIRGKINIPDSINIVVQYTNTFRSREDFHNAPYEFRGFYRLLDQKHRDEINLLAGKRHRLSEKKRSRGFLEIDKEMFLSWALFYLLKNLFGNIERSNHFLSEGRVSISIESLHTMSFEEAFTDFIKSQNLFPVDSILNLVGNLIEVKEHIIEYDDAPQDIKVARVYIENIQKLQLAYLEYENSMYKIAGSGVPYGFIDFDWHGLSTGEKAYLDLYSRLFYAKKKIYGTIRQQRIGKKNEQFPKNIILLLDEGELGFHLQWQKEYIKNLIDIVPLLFQPENPNIQMIFSTHSPVSLSDIPRHNIVYLKKEDGFGTVVGLDKQPKYSFGANIHDLIQDSFYLKDGYMGDFASSVIQRAIDWCLNREIKTDAETIQKLISLIDEPIIRVKLSEMFAEKMGDNVERARLEAQRDYILKRLNELDNNDTN
jgi:hypothetical protein